MFPAPLHRSGHPVAGVGNDLTDAALVSAPSWAALFADGLIHPVFEPRRRRPVGGSGSFKVAYV